MSDDFDELTSAYLDGQATPDEIARVEADPGLMAEVESMRALADRLIDSVPPADDAIRAHHLAVGMAAFDELFGSATDTAAPRLVSVSEAGDTVGPEQGGDELAKRRQTRATRNGLPSWLSAAAVLLLVVAGVGWIARQSTDDDFASDATEAADQFDDTDAADNRAAGEEVQATEAAADESTEEATAAAESESDDSAGQPASDGEDADAAAVAPAPSTTTPAGGGFFPEEEVAKARVEFDETPDPAQMASLLEGALLEAELSTCGFDVEGAVGELIGFIPISVAGADREVLVYSTAGTDELATLVVDATCTILP